MATGVRHVRHDRHVRHRHHSSTRVGFVAALIFIESALRTRGTESAGRLPERIVRLREKLEHFVLPRGGTEVTRAP